MGATAMASKQHLPPADISAYVHGELSAAQQQAYDAHLRACPACRAMVAQARAAFVALDTPVRQFAAPDVRDAVRAHAEQPARRWRVRPAWVFAMAVATIMLAVSVFTGHLRHQQQRAPLVRCTAPTTTPAIAHMPPPPVVTPTQVVPPQPAPNIIRPPRPAHARTPSAAGVPHGATRTPRLSQGAQSTPSPSPTLGEGQCHHIEHTTRPVPAVPCPGIEPPVLPPISPTPELANVLQPPSLVPGSPTPVTPPASPVVADIPQRPPPVMPEPFKQMLPAPGAMPLVADGGLTSPMVGRVVPLGRDGRIFDDDGYLLDVVTYRAGPGMVYIVSARRLPFFEPKMVKRGAYAAVPEP